MKTMTRTNKKLKTYTPIHTANNDMVFKKIYLFNIYGWSKLCITFLFTFCLALSSMNAQDNFLQKQLNYVRVQDAFDLKEQSLKSSFLLQGLTFPPKEILVRAFKSEQELELWVKEEETFVLFKSYPICRSSGVLGPKLQKGDQQVPEGFYFVDRFNPVSSFWLSLGLNYPNKLDLIRSNNLDPGADIFIHGDCVTIGCMPMTDDLMKEIYVLAVLSKNTGQDKIPVHVFPYRFDTLNNTIYHLLYPNWIAFWKNLEEEYEYFETYKRIRKVSNSQEGLYIFTE